MNHKIKNRIIQFLFVLFFSQLNCELAFSQSTTINCSEIGSGYSGVCYEYFPSGSMKEKHTYKNGFLNGEQIYNSQDSNYIVIKIYKAGKLEGVKEIRKYKNRKPEVIFYEDSLFRMNGKYIRYYSNGKIETEGMYKICKGELVNQLDSVHRGVRISAATWEDGMKVGKWVEYYDNGVIKSTGIYDTIFLTHSDTAYVNGKGEKVSELSVIVGDTTGDSTSSISVKIYTQNREAKDEKWIYYKRDGSVERIEIWNKGTLISTKVQ